MKKSVNVSAAAVFIAAVCCCFLFCASVPSGTLWDGYVVLYVSKEVPERTVLGELDHAGVRNVITQSGQSVPVVSHMTPVQPETFDPLSYISRRSAYFFDEAAAFRLFYIPERYSDAVPDAVAALLSAQPSARAGFDAAGSYPVVVPLICAAVFACFIAVSKRRTYMLCAGLLPVAYVLCSPLYTSAAAAGLALYALFLFQRLWNRTGWFSAAIGNRYIRVPLILSVAAAFAGSPASGGLFALALAGTAAVLFVLREAESYRENRRRFRPVPVRTARCVPVADRFSVPVLAVPAAAAAVLLVCFLAVGYAPSDNAGGKIALPAPAAAGAQRDFSVASYERAAASGRQGADRLPGMAEYVTWAWNTLTFPYRSLNSTVSASPVVAADETVSYPVYARSGHGVISEQLKTVYVFNDEFIGTVLEPVTAEYAGVESLLKRQNGFKSIEYRSGGVQSGGKKTAGVLSCIFLVCSAAIPAVLAGMFFWRKQK